eukprot:14407306-Heterocapsa_arctica.AAC.1
MSEKVNARPPLMRFASSTRFSATKFRRFPNTHRRATGFKCAVARASAVFSDSKKSMARCAHSTTSPEKNVCMLLRASMRSWRSRFCVLASVHASPMHIFHAAVAVAWGE